MSTAGSSTLPSVDTRKRSSTWLSSLGLRRVSREAGAESLSGVAIRSGTLGAPGLGGAAGGGAEAQAAKNTQSARRRGWKADLMACTDLKTRLYLNTRSEASLIRGLALSAILYIYTV